MRNDTRGKLGASYGRVAAYARWKVEAVIAAAALPAYAVLAGKTRRPVGRATGSTRFSQRFLIRMTGLFLIVSSTMPMALADTVLTYRPNPQPADDFVGGFEVFVSDGRVLLKGDAADGTTHRVWFDAAADTIRVLDNDAVGYRVMTPRAAKRHMARYESFRETIEERTERYDEAEIAEALALVSQIESREFGGGPAPRIEFRGLDGTGRGNDGCIPTGVFRARGDDWVRERTLCLVDIGERLDNEDDASTLMAFGAVSREIAGTLASYARWLPRFAIDLSEGLPVRIEYLQDGALPTLTLHSVSNVPIESAVFAVPASHDRRLSAVILE